MMFMRGFIVRASLRPANKRRNAIMIRPGKFVMLIIAVMGVRAARRIGLQGAHFPLEHSLLVVGVEIVLISGLGVFRRG